MQTGLFVLLVASQGSVWRSHHKAEPVALCAGESARWCTCWLPGPSLVKFRFQRQHGVGEGGGLMLPLSFISFAPSDPLGETPSVVRTDATVLMLTVLGFSSHLCQVF